MAISTYLSIFTINVNGLSVSCIASRFFSLLSGPPRKPKNIGVGSLSLLQGIFLAQGLNWSLLHFRQILNQLRHQERPNKKKKCKIIWKIEAIKKDKEGHCIITRINIEDITLVNIYTLNTKALKYINGEGNGNPFQYSHLKNAMDRSTWWATVHELAKQLDPTQRLNNKHIKYGQKGKEQTGIQQLQETLISHSHQWTDLLDRKE